MGNLSSSRKSKNESHRRVIGNANIAERLSNPKGKYYKENTNIALQFDRHQVYNATDDVWRRQLHHVTSHCLVPSLINETICRETVFDTSTKQSSLKPTNDNVLHVQDYNYAYYEEIPFAIDTLRDDIFESTVNPDVILEDNSSLEREQVSPMQLGETESNTEIYEEYQEPELSFKDKNLYHTEEKIHRRFSYTDFEIKTGKVRNHDISLNGKVQIYLIDALIDKLCETNREMKACQEHKDITNVFKQQYCCGSDDMKLKLLSPESSSDAISKVSVECTETKTKDPCAATASLHLNDNVIVADCVESYKCDGMFDCYVHEEKYDPVECSIDSEASSRYENKSCTFDNEGNLLETEPNAHKEKIKKLSEASKCSEYEEVVDVFKPLILHNLDVREILPHLHFVDPCTVDAIYDAVKRTRREAVGCLLDYLKRCKTVDYWYKFLKALNDCGYEYIVKNLRGYPFIGHQYQEEYIRSLTPKLNQMIRARELLPHLIAEDVISHFDKEEIEQESENRGNINAVNLLLLKIPRKHTLWYSKFLTILRSTGFHEAAKDLDIPHIVDIKQLKSCPPKTQPRTSLLEQSQLSEAFNDSYINGIVKITNCKQNMCTIKKEKPTPIQDICDNALEILEFENSKLRYQLYNMNKEVQLLKEKAQIRSQLIQSAKERNLLRDNDNHMENELQSLISAT